MGGAKKIRDRVQRRRPAGVPKTEDQGRVQQRGFRATSPLPRSCPWWSTMCRQLQTTASATARCSASTAELTQWSEVAKSLNKGCFVEQDTATLLCGHLGVIMYVIANADIDHLQVTKCADPD
ncbi:hypothetical protein WJX77_006718 [Trebouxia sp. C0004]